MEYLDLYLRDSRVLEWFGAPVHVISHYEAISKYEDGNLSMSMGLPSRLDMNSSTETVWNKDNEKQILKGVISIGGPQSESQASISFQPPVHDPSSATASIRDSTSLHNVHPSFSSFLNKSSSTWLKVPTSRDTRDTPESSSTYHQPAQLRQQARPVDLDTIRGLQNAVFEQVRYAPESYSASADGNLRPKSSCIAKTPCNPAYQAQSSVPLGCVSPAATFDSAKSGQMMNMEPSTQTSGCCAKNGAAKPCTPSPPFLKPLPPKGTCCTDTASPRNPATAKLWSAVAVPAAPEDIVGSIGVENTSVYVPQRIYPYELVFGSVFSNHELPLHMAGIVSDSVRVIWHRFVVDLSTFHLVETISLADGRLVIMLVDNCKGAISVIEVAVVPYLPLSVSISKFVVASYSNRSLCGFCNSMHMDFCICPETFSKRRKPIMKTEQTKSWEDYVGFIQTGRMQGNVDLQLCTNPVTLAHTHVFCEGRKGDSVNTAKLSYFPVAVKRVRFGVSSSSDMIQTLCLHLVTRNLVLARNPVMRDDSSGAEPKLMPPLQAKAAFGPNRTGVSASTGSIMVQSGHGCGTGPPGMSLVPFLRTRLPAYGELPAVNGLLSFGTGMHVVANTHSQQQLLLPQPGPTAQLEALDSPYQPMVNGAAIEVLDTSSAYGFVQPLTPCHVKESDLLPKPVEPVAIAYSRNHPEHNPTADRRPSLPTALVEKGLIVADSALMATTKLTPKGVEGPSASAAASKLFTGGSGFGEIKSSKDEETCSEAEVEDRNPMRSTRAEASQGGHSDDGEDLSSSNMEDDEDEGEDDVDSPVQNMECQEERDASATNLSQEGRRAFKCPKCDKTFRNKSSMKRHVRALHDNLQPFKCKYCDATFRHNYTMETHISLVHLKQKKYKCSICGLSFATSSNVQRHHRERHENSKPFECRECGVAFSKRSNFQRHVKSSAHINRCKATEGAGPVSAGGTSSVSQVSHGSNHAVTPTPAPTSIPSENPPSTTPNAVAGPSLMES